VSRRLTATVGRGGFCGGLVEDGVVRLWSKDGSVPVKPALAKSVVGVLQEKAGWYQVVSCRVVMGMERNVGQTFLEEVQLAFTVTGISLDEECVFTEGGGKRITQGVMSAMTT
jgi:hypothetical protein